MVSRRTETDVIDIGYTAGDPATAQRIVNATVQAFQSINVKWARERSRRRREFLAEQLGQTDSMLARAQAELASFRSRQQLASSADKLKAEQGTQMQLETRMAELDADRRTFGALQQQLKSSDEATRSEAHPRAGHLAGHGRERRDQRHLPPAAPVPGPAGLDDHRAVAGRRRTTPT